MDNENKLPDEFKYTSESKIAKKLDNFWYYHKWKVLAAAFVILVIAICVYSCISKPKTDISLLYAGPYSSYDSSVVNINKELTDIMPDSFGDDGAVLNVLEIYSAEQITALAEKEVADYIAETKEELSEEEIQGLITRQENSLAQLTTTNSKSLSSYLQMGNYSIYLLDPSIYEQYKSIGVFAKLSDIFGEDIPKSAFSDDAIKLSETELYKSSSSGIASLPEDTLLCIRVKPVFGSGCKGEKSNNEEYNKAVEMFKKIVNNK